LKGKLARLGLTGKAPLQAFDIATAVNRQDEYREMYKVYSKLTHASAWAILGGSEEPVSWESFALLLLLKANRYAATCFLTIARRVGFAQAAPAAAVSP
jgi:hypothetical protein